MVLYGPNFSLMHVPNPFFLIHGCLHWCLQKYDKKYSFSFPDMALLMEEIWTHPASISGLVDV